MMNKNKSANINLMRFLFILPLLVVVLLAFRGVAIDENNTYQGGPITDTIPAAAPVTIDNLFKKKGIKEITVKTRESDKKDIEARVTRTNGTVEVFNLSDPEQREAFERKYGDVKPPAPPLPPAPALAPRGVAAAGKATIPAPAPVAAPGEAPVAVPAKPAAPGTPKAAPAPPEKVNVKVREQLLLRPPRHLLLSSRMRWTQ